MNIKDVFILLQFLDNIFELGGKLLAVAIEKAPILKTDPLPTLDDMDKARQEALDRIFKNEESK